MGLQLPWNAHDTPQVKGRKAEKPMAKKVGARVHPNSGAGSIKNDMSTDNAIIEMKTAGKSHTLSAKYLEGVYTNATRQGKDAVLLIVFPNVTLTAHITRTER
jgi:hypothetical protein